MIVTVALIVGFVLVTLAAVGASVTAIWHVFGLPADPPYPHEVER